MKPLYIFDGNDATGAARCHYECPLCHAHFHRGKVIEDHMGLTANIPHSCSVLQAEDEKRRASLRNLVSGHE